MKHDTCRDVHFENVRHLGKKQEDIDHSLGFLLCTLRSLPSVPLEMTVISQAILIPVIYILTSFGNSVTSMCSRRCQRVTPIDAFTSIRTSNPQHHQLL